jgi:protein-L-isoaspartate(D-aspartate) O-methyltransferase
MTLEECRRFYAEGIKLAANINSTPLLKAFARVPRESFLGPGPWKIPSMCSGFGQRPTYTETPDADPRHLYHNLAISLDPTRDLNNGEPVSLAKWIEALALKNGDRVYHLGCGVGYYTAIIAEVVGARGHVLASEIDPELAALASKNLAAYSNVFVQSGNGAMVDPGQRDGIFINAGVTHPHPKWLDSLSEGGRLVLPLTVNVGMSPNVGSGIMAKFTRVNGGFSAQIVTQVAIFSCVSMRDAQYEQALRDAMRAGKLFNMRSLRRDVHEATDTCLVHGVEICLSSSEVDSSGAMVNLSAGHNTSPNLCLLDRT